VTRRVDAALAGPVAKAMKRKRPLAVSDIEVVQLGALEHPDPQVRRWCLFILDHFANDQSMEVFAKALADAEPLVRDLALHSIACESCKQEELCVVDTVPHVIQVLMSDSSVRLRINAISALLRLAGRDGRAREALQAAADSDADPLVRKCAQDAATSGYFVPPKKRYERRQRRHAIAHRL